MKKEVGIRNEDFSYIKLKNTVSFQFVNFLILATTKNTKLRCTHNFPKKKKNNNVLLNEWAMTTQKVYYAPNSDHHYKKPMYIFSTLTNHYIV